MKGRDCNDCVHFWKHDDSEYTGTCWMDGSRRDVKETCWYWLKRLTDRFRHEDSIAEREKALQ